VSPSRPRSRRRYSATPGAGRGTGGGVPGRRLGRAGVAALLLKQPPMMILVEGKEGKHRDDDTGELTPKS
jgi:hypothetical protein